MSTGNNSKNNAKARAKTLRFTSAKLVVIFADGRELSVPLGWYPSLKRATPSHRARWIALNSGEAFHWPSLDLDLSVAGIVAGLPEIIPSPPTATSTTNRSARRRSA